MGNDESMGGKFSIEEMQKWNKRYKLNDDSVEPTIVIDSVTGEDYWLVESSDAYRLCVELNMLYDEISMLKDALKFAIH